MSLLFTIQNLSLTFGTKNLFQKTNLSVEEGEKLGLIGLNGHGKSSLFKIICDRLTPDSTVPPFRFDKKKEGLKALLIPQELPEEVLDLTLSDSFFYFYPELKDLHDNHPDIFEQNRGWELLGIFESYLKYFGLTDPYQVIRPLSGGEQKKLLLSLGLSSYKDLILWDEPTNHLDMETIELFEDELKSSDKTIMLISHDRYLLSNVTNKIVHITRGNIEKFNGGYAEYLEHRAQKEVERKKLLNRLRNKHKRELDWMRQGIKARGTRSKKRVEGYHDLASKISDVKGEALKKLQLNIKSSGRKTKQLIEMKDLSIGYNDKPLWTKLNRSVAMGDKIGLIGPNGCGKTTLLNCIRETLAPLSGTLKLAEDMKIQYFSQKREELDLAKTPYEVLGDGNDYVELPGGHKQHVASYFQQFLFTKDQLHRPMKTFSGGEKNRLQLAINLKKDADIWLFDEPTNDLDLETLNILEKTLSDFKGSLILISHDRAFLSGVTNKIWLFKEGEIEFFNAGYEQVEPYLETVRLEAQMKKDHEKKNKKNKKEEVIPEVIETKSTNVNAQKIQSSIDKSESTISKIDELLQQMASNPNPDAATSKSMKDLQSKKDNLEEDLLSLYEELES